AMDNLFLGHSIKGGIGKYSNIHQIHQTGALIHQTGALIHQTGALIHQTGAL
ncbi:hypothetical protein L9F63_006745, partial [Diploptera punctata]